MAEGEGVVNQFDEKARLPRCTAFQLDTTCIASDPCQVHGCTDVDLGDASGCYCDPERTPPDEFICRWCPPGCKSCEPEDCECYTHQDEPDRAFSPGPVQP